MDLLALETAQLPTKQCHLAAGYGYGSDQAGYPEDEDTIKIRRESFVGHSSTGLLRSLSLDSWRHTHTYCNDLSSL